MTETTAITISLRLVVDVAHVRSSYDEYAGDVAWYRDHDELDPAHADSGYRTGIVPEFEDYLGEWINDVAIGGVLSAGGDFVGWRVEQA